MTPLETFEIALFVVSALLTLGGGIATIAARRPIRSAMGLFACILGVAGCYMLLNAQFLAAVQLIVYAGAVVVLFIFVVMLLGSAAFSPPDAGSAVPRYLGAAVFLASIMGAVVLLLNLAYEPPVLTPSPEGFGSIEALGAELFTAKIIPFELTGALLLVAVVGALAVARGKQRDPSKEAEPAPVQDDEASSPEAAK